MQCDPNFWYIGTSCMYNTCAILDNFGLINPIRGDALVKRNPYVFIHKQETMCRQLLNVLSAAATT